MADGTTGSHIPSGGDSISSFRLRSLNRLPVLLQTELAECGLTSLAMIANYYGHDTDLAGLRRRFSTSLKGVTLGRLVDMARTLGFTCRPVKLDLASLPQLRTPCVLHWNLDHFVVLKSATARGVVIHDPASGVRKLSMREVSDHFTGVALELTPAANFKPETERRAITLRALAGRVRGVVPALMQILALAFALEIATLVGPFYLQWVLDQVVISNDRDLLTLLGLGFLCVTTFSALITAARSWAVVWLGATLNAQWQGNLFAHLIKLPLSWFERRHIGDVVSRFSSLQSIQKTLTTQFMESLLDGLMSLITVAVMALYNVALTALVAGLLLSYACLRWLFFRPLRQANEEQIIFGARQHSEMLESIRGAMPIKLANKQDERAVRYTNATVAAINRDIRIQRLTLACNFGNQWMFGVGRVVLIWAAASLALKNQMSVGMLVAFVAYSDQFIARSTGLFDKLSDFRMLKLHAERVADIALSEPEDVPASHWGGATSSASTELRNVSFRYADGEPWILKDCNLSIAAGDSVAITGPSGCGKSTLVKILLGLLEPTQGEVLFGGIEIRKLGLSAYRDQLAAVMQDDQLFAGSIADNISFFHGSATMEKVEAAARLAAIHDDIASMPMGYQSLVGDMGSSLSGGQRQRVILARALYRRPKLLVLDEATSHLDIARERSVNRAVRQMDLTCIVIAHRPETIAAMNRVIEMVDGALVSDRAA